MDFSPTPEQVEVTALAARILGDGSTQERLQATERTGTRFDRELWRTVAEAGLLGLAVPESLGGAGLGLLESTSVLVEAGRVLAALPLPTHLPAVDTLAAYGGPDEVVTGAASGAVVLTAALDEERAYAPARPSTTATRTGDGWHLAGRKVAVRAGTVADAFLVTASTDDGTRVFLLDADQTTITPQRWTDGDRVARLDLDVTLPSDRALGEGAAAYLGERLVLAACAQAFGTVSGALAETASYAKQREQFGRPIGTFQAVSQRLADGYIDALGAELTLWQAAWRLAEGLPSRTHLATAKLWAADACSRVSHTAVHVHGGVGIDRDAPTHRYFTAAQALELAFGGTTDQARRIGRALAAEPG